VGRGALVLKETKIKEDIVFNQFEKRIFLERKKMFSLFQMEGG
jgi:hypothetical protein